MFATDSCEIYVKIRFIIQKMHIGFVIVYKIQKNCLTNAPCHANI